MSSVAISEQVLDRVEKNGWRIATQWGLGIVVCLGGMIWFGWRATTNETFIRETLMKQATAQQEVISQNGEQLKQNSALIQSNQQCLENCTRAYIDVCKTLDRAIENMKE